MTELDTEMNSYHFVSRELYRIIKHYTIVTLLLKLRISQESTLCQKCFAASGS